MLLNKKEKAVMKIIHKKASENNGVCLITPHEILTQIPYKLAFKKEDLAPTLRSLALSDYFEVIESNKKGELVYCVTLHGKGQAFLRDLQSERKAVYMKIILSVCGAVGAFLITQILQAIFS